jgi:hypothetical protein
MENPERNQRGNQKWKILRETEGAIKNGKS